MKLRKAKKHLFIPIAAFAAACALVSCGKSIDTMIDEYNGTLDRDSGGGEEEDSSVTRNVTDEGSSLGPGDEGFHEWDMLKDSYTVTNDGSLQLAAPNHGCKDWSWSLFRYDVISPMKFKPYFVKGSRYDNTGPQHEWYGTTRDKDTINDLRRINIYVPDSSLMVGIYAIKLVVTGEKDNLPYTDVAIINIIPRLTVPAK